MKILIVQLARLGDIFQTWPVIAGLRRMNPGAEIHLLTRAKFAPAAPGSPHVDKHWLLDTRDVLSPLIDERPGIDEALARLEAFCSEVGREGFSQIVNLSFSPFSSYLVREVSAGQTCEVRGYTRFDDGFLNIPDDGSAYFYAQVGPDRGNRLHVTDLFAHVAGIDLTDEDWTIAPQHGAVAAGEDFAVLHIGASESGKTFSPTKWGQITKGLLAAWPGKVVLVGASDESDRAEAVASVSGERKPVNLVGRTTLDELFQIIAQAKLVIGGDSGPVQIASLTNTPTLNISLPMVSFWETGPRAKGSRILPIESEANITSEEIVAEALAVLMGQPSKGPVIRVSGRTVPYVETRPQPGAFEWALLRAIYMGERFPDVPNGMFIAGLERLRDLNELAREQINAIRASQRNTTASMILDQVDALMDQVGEMVPELAPIVRWFKTERTRLGPMPVGQLIESTDIVHKRLGDVISVYLPSSSPTGGAAIDASGGLQTGLQGEVR